MSQQSFSFGPWNNSLGRFNKTYLAIFFPTRVAVEAQSLGCSEAEPQVDDKDENRAREACDSANAATR
jgi:hypothetical protein